MPAPIVDPRFATRLRTLRADRGLSHRALGALTKYSHTYLWEIERGRKEPTADVAAALDAALDARGALTGLIAHPASPLDPDDEERLTALVTTPCGIDRDCLDASEALLASERNREDVVGAKPVIPVATRQLAILTAAISSTPSELTRDACLIAGQWAQFAGWLHTAVGQYSKAGLRLDRALEWATLAGSPDLIATSLSFKAHAAWLQGEVGMTACLNDAVLRMPNIYVGQVAYDAFQQARIAAIGGSTLTAERDLAVALDLASQAVEDQGEMPPWHYYRTRGFWRLQHGVVLALLSRTDRRFGERAVEQLRAGADLLPGEHRMAEWYGDFLLHEIRVCDRIGDRDSVAAALARLHSIVDVTGSSALAERVARVSHPSC